MAPRAARRGGATRRCRPGRRPRRRPVVAALGVAFDGDALVGLAEPHIDGRAVGHGDLDLPHGAVLAVTLDGVAFPPCVIFSAAAVAASACGPVTEASSSSLLAWTYAAPPRPMAASAAVPASAFLIELRIRVAPCPGIVRQRMLGGADELAVSAHEDDRMSRACTRDEARSVGGRRADRGLVHRWGGRGRVGRRSLGRRCGGVGRRRGGVGRRRGRVGRRRGRVRRRGRSGGPVSSGGSTGTSVSLSGASAGISTSSPTSDVPVASAATQTERETRRMSGVGLRNVRSAIRRTTT